MREGDFQVLRLSILEFGGMGAIVVPRPLPSGRRIWLDGWKIAPIAVELKLVHHGFGRKGRVGGDGAVSLAVMREVNGVESVSSMFPPFVK